MQGSEEARERTLVSLRQLLAVNQDMRRRLRGNEVLIRRAIREMEKGSTVAATMEATTAGFGRQQVYEGLEALTLARHELRLAVTVAGLEEGMTAADLGRAWGISRQLASRLVKEARGEL